MIIKDLIVRKDFTGGIEYVKTDYVDGVDRSYTINFSYENGKLASVTCTGESGETKFLNRFKWNENFWRNAPKYLFFDGCEWKRTSIYWSDFTVYKEFENTSQFVHGNMVSVMD